MQIRGVDLSSDYNKGALSCLILSLVTYIIAKRQIINNKKEDYYYFFFVSTIVLLFLAGGLASGGKSKSGQLKIKDYILLLMFSITFVLFICTRNVQYGVYKEIHCQEDGFVNNSVLYMITVLIVISLMEDDTPSDIDITNYLTVMLTFITIFLFWSKTTSMDRDFNNIPYHTPWYIKIPLLILGLCSASILGLKSV